jgi:uroporphyrinogen decarboxylase
MLTALRFEQPDRPPHFEPMFELEREAFGLRFPDRGAWDGCTARAKERMIGTCMDIYERIVERFRWDALLVFWPWSDPDGVRAARRTFGSDILVGGVIGGGVWSIEGMTDWMQFSADLVERPEAIHAEARLREARTVERVQRLAEAGAEFIHLVNDVAFNAGPFVSPAQFAEFVTPYWRREVQAVRRAGCIPFIHSDGQLMPVLDQLLSLEAACLQSVDPMAGMDIAEVKRRTYGRLALMGNVKCSVLQDGPRDAIRESALYCLAHGTPGGGYIFGTSNTIFPGMPLENYEYMLEVYREFCAGPGNTSRPGMAEGKGERS